jgi:hypothetical protein
LLAFRLLPQQGRHVDETFQFLGGFFVEASLRLTPKHLLRTGQHCHSKPFREPSCLAQEGFQICNCFDGFQLSLDRAQVYACPIICRESYDGNFTQERDVLDNDAGRTAFFFPIILGETNANRYSIDGLMFHGCAQVISAGMVRSKFTSYEKAIRITL